MAVVKKKSDLFRAEGAPVVDPLLYAGRTFTKTGTVSNEDTDESGSTYRIADLPADCVLKSTTAFDVENWGFAQVVIGTLSDTDALIDVARSAAATQAPIAFGDANHAKRLWEVLGLAENPGGDIALYAHAEATATAAGAMPFQIEYLVY